MFLYLIFRCELIHPIQAPNEQLKNRCQTSRRRRSETLSSFVYRGKVTASTSPQKEELFRANRSEPQLTITCQTFGTGNRLLVI